ncbi:MAG TPA: DUF302 domain-containing protein [Steroidobacteraceae bacterium]|nr:DUF302 domain-containing protein [Steroidobacteraceae bacterium]
MSYYIAKTVNMPFSAAIDAVTAALKEQGFGVLTDIDVQATLKAKIGAETGKYRILGACNPRFAHEALKLEDKLGVLLPCNVIVRETSGGGVEVASIDPVAAMERTGNPALRSTAEEVRRRLAGALEQLAPDGERR